LPWAVAATLAALVVVGAGVWVGLSWMLTRRWPWVVVPEVPSQSDILKLAFGIVAAVGATIALTVNYRRQRHLELDAAGRRDEVRLLTERFGAAAAQLGGDQAAVRLAGVYAIAALADEWEGQRQQCIDVLCGYLRLPYTGEPPPGHPELVVEQRQYAAGSVQRTETTRYRPGEVQVRQAIVSTIVEHLHDGAENSWSDLNFDFSGALLIDPPFSGTTFSGAARFDRATFVGDVWFDAVVFAGDTSFRQTQFTGNVWLRGVLFSGDASFHGATFAGTARFHGPTFLHVARFEEATFSGPTFFDRGKFSGSAYFRGATFLSAANFYHATFSSGALFGGALFCGAAHFDHATFAGTTQFNNARFSGQEQSFAGAAFNGSTTFHGASFIRASDGLDTARDAMTMARFRDPDRVRWGPIPRPEVAP
jgi:uncharacterized protein YjbI with pentapeptide repeats